MGEPGRAMLVAHLVLPAVVGLAIAQAGLHGLARLLGRPLRAATIATGLALPWILLAPWVSSAVVLAPSSVLDNLVPGLTPSALDTHATVLNDAVLQFLPWELEVRRALADHRLPLWSDRVDGGSSPWENPQAQALSPIAMLARAAPLQHFLLVALALEVLVAFEGTWVLARMLGCRAAAATVAGASFALGGGIAAWALFPHTAAAAWAPWVGAACLAVARRPDGRRLGGLALASACLFLSGHPEVALAAVCLAALAALGLRRRGRGLGRTIGACALGGLLGAMLAAPHLVPFALAVPESLRAAERSRVSPGSPTPSAAQAEWFAGLGERFFRGPFSPVAFGEPYGEGFSGPWGWPVALSSYTGLAAVLGAAAAMGSRARRRAAPFVLFAGVALLLASRFSVLEALLLQVPGLRFVELSRFLPVGCLALCVAAGLGWQQLTRPAVGPRAALAMAAVVSGIVSASGEAAALLAGLTAAGLVAAAVMASRMPRAALLGVGAVVLVDLVPWARAQLPADPAGTFFPATRPLELLARELGEGPWRATGEDYLAYPGVLPAYGIAEVRPHNPMAGGRYLLVLEAAFGFSPDSEEYFSPFANPGHPLLDFLNVRVLVSGRLGPPAAGFEEIRELRAPPLRFYRNREALPRWFAPASVACVPAADVLAQVGRLEDARGVVVAREDCPGGAMSPAVAVAGRAVEPGLVRLSVGGTGPRVVATSLPGPRGWAAVAAARRLPAFAVNGAFLGVGVPDTVSELAIAYRPPGMVAGCLLAALAATACALLAVRAPSLRAAPAADQ